MAHEQPEATEIQVFGMVTDTDGSGRIADVHEITEYYDILVRGDAGDDGEIPEIEEHEDLSEEMMNALVPILEEKYGLVAEYVRG